MRGLISYANGSISSIYGCIGYNVQDMIIQIFGDHFFNYVSMASELATRNVRRVLGVNTNNEFIKRQKPELIIQPTFATMEENGALQGIPLTSNFNNLQYGTSRGYLMEMIKDPRSGYTLKYKLNRDRIDYEVTINLDTLEQQLNVYKVLQNKMIWNSTVGKPVALEAIIPKRLIHQISKICDMDLELRHEYIPILIKRLNSFSMYPITYKIKNSTATDEWFMYYTHTVHFNFTDLRLESGSKKGMSEDRYPITFAVQAEFNLPGMFYLEGMKTFTEGVEISLRSMNSSDEPAAEFPIYTIPSMFTRFPPELDGKQLYGSTIFKTDKPKPGKPIDTEVVRFGDVLDPDMQRVVRIYFAWNMNPMSLLRIIVTKNRETLREGVDFRVDYNQLQLIVNKPDWEVTYRLVIYFDHGTVNEILSNEKYNEVYDIPRVVEKNLPAGLQDGVYVGIQGTPKTAESDDMVLPKDERSDQEGINTLEKIEHPDPPHGDPSLVLMKDRFLIEQEGYMVDADHIVTPGDSRENSDGIDTSEPGDLYDILDPNDPGIPTEQIHVHVREDPHGSRRIHESGYTYDPNLSPGENYNLPMIDPNLKEEVDHIVKVKVPEKKKSEKIYHSSIH